MPLLEVKRQQVRVDDREILYGLSLTVNEGEVHAIMGRTAPASRRLSHVIAGKPGYEVTGGEILYRGEDLLEMAPDERAAKGVFLAFQYPVEIPGVATMNFLRTALTHSARRARERISHAGFSQESARGRARLNIPQDMLRRGVNVGFSGGEKNDNEILQMALFEPSLCILDEMDSSASTSTRCELRPDGVNALRLERSRESSSSPTTNVPIFVPDFVHVMSRARSSRAAAKTWRWSWKLRLHPVRGRGLNARSGFFDERCVGKNRDWTGAQRRFLRSYARPAAGCRQGRGAAACAFGRL